MAECEWRTLVAIAEVLYPGPQREVSPAEIADNVDRFLVRGHSKRAWRIRALLQLVEWVPVAALGKPLSKLALPERRRMVLDHYVEGRGLWQVCAKIRYLVLLGAYGDARMHAPTSYVPVPKRRRFLATERNGGTPVPS